MDNGASSYRRFLDGDENGIVEIVRDYKDGLMLYLNSYVRNIHIAEDLTEDTFVKIMVKKPRFSEKSSFKTWLYAIGRNLVIDYSRKKNNAIYGSIEESELILRDEEDIEKNYIQNEWKIDLHRNLKKLKSEYQQVLYLVYFEEFSNSQVAYVMGKNKKQVENLMYRAKLSLKSELEKEGFVYEDL